ncbi:hypothetical protein ACTQ53_09400 [Prevotella sp. Sow4_E9_plate]|uniref:hypothetical protein n=1 Tax=Prevotella sp. Sow4_E9_plate TaxID=3438802 RepID=UPI003F9669C8
MADNKKQRKSTRSFNMEKHVERHFDIEKEQVPVLDAPQNKTIDVQTQETDGGNNGNGSKNKMVAIIAVIVLIVVAFVAYRSCGTNEPKVDELTNTIVSDSTEKADTTSNEEKSASPISEQSQLTSSEVSSETGTNAESDNTSAVPTTKSESSGKSIEEKAMQVWDGVYGNGTERKSKLGSDYKAVQKRVNEMYRNGYRH